MNSASAHAGCRRLLCWAAPLWRLCAELCREPCCAVCNVPCCAVYERRRVSEAPMLGCAVLAAVAAGLYPDIVTAVDFMVHVDRVVHPDPEVHKQYRWAVQAVRAAWAQAVVHTGVYVASRAGQIMFAGRE